MNHYDGVDIHRRMIADSVRTGAFQRSLAATVRPGDVVLDVGAGTGILSLLAARAGASRVYALERAPGAARLARRMIAANGLADRVFVLAMDAERAWPFETVDLLVSEWLGAYAVDENMLAPVLTARDRWLRAGGTMIPGTTEVWLAPVRNAAGAEATAFHSPLYGLDLAVLAPFSLEEMVWLPRGAAPADLRAKPSRLWSVDPATMPSPRARRPFVGEAEFTLEGPANGLAIWFSAAMPGTEPLTNAPGTPTHWGNFLLPISCAAAARASSRLRVRVQCIPIPGDACEHTWSASLDHGPAEYHDTRRRPRSFLAPPWRVSFAAS